MKIRKVFTTETAHIVRNAYSKRCSHSMHGHSYKYEVILHSNCADNAGMVTDFGFIKKYIGPLFDSFDHASIIMGTESNEFINFFKNNFDRVVIANWNSTAEMQAMYFYHVIKKLIEYLNEKKLWECNEQQVNVYSVKVHETASGYAEYDVNSYNNFNNKINMHELFNIFFSTPIKEDWPDEFSLFYEWLLKHI